MLTLQQISAVVAVVSSIAAAQPTTQEQFDRALPRVSKWVAGLFDRSDPIVATVEVLDAEAFRERAIGQLHIPGDALPGAMIAVTKPDASILVSAPMFETLVKKATEHDLFADDMVTLVLAHELTHAVHLDTLASIKLGPNAGTALLERILIASVVREAHAVFIQHEIATMIGGDPFEQFSRDLIASTLLASPRAKTVAAAEMMLRLEHQRGGHEAVMNVLKNPPASGAEILERSSTSSVLADSVADAIEEVLDDGNWTRVTREGLQHSLGQAWRWLTPEQQADLKASMAGSKLVTLIDGAAGPPKLVSVSILEFNNAEGAQQAPKQLHDVMSLMMSRFAYTKEGERRDVALEDLSPGSPWRFITGDHPLSSGKWGFGAVAIATKGNLFIIVNAVNTPSNETKVERMLRCIQSAL